MPISFSSIPSDWKIPLYYVEVDSSKAGLPTNVKPAMLVGHMIDTGAAAGVATADIPIPIASQAQADYQFGKGSQLANMFRAYFANNWAGQVYGLPMAEGTTASTGSIAVSAAPTVAGTLHLYIGGYHVPVSVAADDTAAEVATAIKDAIVADVDLPVTATVTTPTTTVNITCKGKGLYGDDILMSDNYYGAVGGQIMPTGLTLTYTPMDNGAGTPTFDDALTNLGETEVEYVCIPFNDSTSLGDWNVEFGFSDTGRWGFIRQLYGHLFSANRASYGDQLTYCASTGLNDGQLSVLGIELLAPSPIWEWAAAYTAKAARALINDPARPLQSLRLEGVLPAKGENRFHVNELNAMAGAGIATQRTLSTERTAFIARETTTYTKNLYGVGDDAYEVVPTLATLAQLLRNQRQAITSKFPRHKIANDGTRFGAGQAIVTPKSIKAELVAQYRIDEFNGLVEDAQAFKNNLIVERDPNDVNRVNVLYPPDLTNQLRVFAVLAQFRLQFSRGTDALIA